MPTLQFTQAVSQSTHSISSQTPPGLQSSTPPLSPPAHTTIFPPIRSAHRPHPSPPASAIPAPADDPDSIPGFACSRQLVPGPILGISRSIWALIPPSSATSTPHSLSIAWSAALPLLRRRVWPVINFSKPLNFSAAAFVFPHPPGRRPPRDPRPSMSSPCIAPANSQNIHPPDRSAAALPGPSRLERFEIRRILDQPARLADEVDRSPSARPASLRHISPAW